MAASSHRSLSVGARLRARDPVGDVWITWPAGRGTSFAAKASASAGATGRSDPPKLRGAAPLDRASHATIAFLESDRPDRPRAGDAYGDGRVVSAVARPASAPPRLRSSWAPGSRASRYPRNHKSRTRPVGRARPKIRQSRVRSVRARASPDRCYSASTRRVERWELLLTTEASRDPGGNTVSGSPLESFLRDRLYGTVPIRGIMGTLGLCPLGLRCTALLARSARRGAHKQSRARDAKFPRKGTCAGWQEPCYRASRLCSGQLEAHGMPSQRVIAGSSGASMRRPGGCSAAGCFAPPT